MNHEDQNNTGPILQEADNNLSQQHPSSKGGMSTDMFCPSCREEICGFYLPTFRCPHCSSMIWRDEEGNVTNSEYHQACPECGRGSASEAAKEALVTGVLGLVHAALLHGLKMKYARPVQWSVFLNQKA